MLRGVLGRRRRRRRARIGPRSSSGSPQQELLYVPLAKGGKPRRIVRARTLGQLLDDLLGWLPRLGLIRETCQLLDIAQAMETEHPVGPGAVTEYDRLFTNGYQAIVRALVASAEDWDDDRAAGGTTSQSDIAPVRHDARRGPAGSHRSRSSTAGSPTAARCG